MNPGLLPPTRGPARSYFEACYWVYTTSGYTIASESTTVTQVLGDDGQPWYLKFATAGPRNVRLRAGLAMQKGDGDITHNLRLWLFDNGVQIVPTVSTSGYHSSARLAGSSPAGAFIDTMIALAAGSHLIDLRHRTVSGTSSTAFGSRYMLAQVLAP